MGLPLEGYRVLDLSVWQQGSYASAMLADMGADVIKIESHSNPDPGRASLSFVTSGRNAYFESLNRGKRSITLELKNEAGQEIFWRLVESADVFHNNMRGGVLERLGITFERIQQVNPRCIMSSATGWGHLGPDRLTGSMDLLAQARGGFMATTGEGSESAPTAAGFPQADHVGAIVSGYGIVLALLHRERGGEAQEVNSSLFGSQLAIQTFNITGAIWGNAMPPRTAHAERRPTWNHFHGSDGKWFSIAALPADKWWVEFCEVMGAPDLAQPPYVTAEDRQARNAEVIARMDGIFATRTRDEWMTAFHARQLLVQPVADHLEVGQDEQAWANGYLVNVTDDDGREWPMVGSPVHLSKTPAQVTKLAPAFGQHTEEVLLEAGYSWEEITAFRERGAFGEPQR